VCAAPKSAYVKQTDKGGKVVWVHTHDDEHHTKQQDGQQDGQQDEQQDEQQDDEGQIMLFEISKSKPAVSPLFAYQTSGSMFDVDVLAGESAYPSYLSVVSIRRIYPLYQLC
jgi:hypothetical protein